MINPIETKGNSLETGHASYVWTSCTKALHGVARDGVLSWLCTWMAWQSSVMVMGTVHMWKKKHKGPPGMAWGGGREDQCDIGRRCVTCCVRELHAPRPCIGSCGAVFGVSCACRQHVGLQRWVTVVEGKLQWKGIGKSINQRAVAWYCSPRRGAARKRENKGKQG